jgi:hypothetical protein
MPDTYLVQILCKLSIVSVDKASHLIVQIMKIMLTIIRFRHFYNYTPQKIALQSIFPLGLVHLPKP